MSATIIPFARAFKGRRPAMMPATAPLPTPLTREWQEQHLPLVDAALDLLGCDDAEFERRCHLMADADGQTLLETLTDQLDRLGGHVGDVVQALAMTAQRIRSTMGLNDGEAEGNPA